MTQAFNEDRFSLEARVRASQSISLPVAVDESDDDFEPIEWGSVTDIYEATEIIITDNQTNLVHEIYVNNSDDESQREMILEKIAELESETPTTDEFLSDN